MAKREQTRVAFHTLGCKINQYESDKLANRFLQAGYQLRAATEEADVYVVNTCTVTAEADRKSRQMIRRMARRSRGSLVVVSGCYAAAWSDQLDETRVLKVDQLEKETLFAKVEESLFGQAREMPEHLDYHTTPALLTKNGDSPVESWGQVPPGPVPWTVPRRTRAYLKVQDGCDRFCTYCIIPYVRGRSRSRPPDEILEEARHLIERGAQEIVVTGICVGDYGRDLSPRRTLSDLFESLLRLPAGRFRLSSFDPCDMDEKLFEWLTSHSRMCRHLHLALQHGSDRILKRMGRDYTRQEFYVLCREFKKRVPHFALTTDVIVGFPGETEEDFEATLSLAETVGFSKIHVFPYSERTGTGAVKHGAKVPIAVRDKRGERLLALSNELSRKFQRSLLNSTQQVLVERERDAGTQWLEGYTSNYIPVMFPGEDALMGQMVAIELVGLQGQKALGRVLAP